ncbi:MAG: hypothetical protein HPY57_16140 [Ignavibacteria bacterium]|nr:hypothetical protein [Ignavibacteria bacterium]
MKKFSNINEKEKVVSVQKPKLNKTVEYFVKENIHIVYDGDADDIIGKKLTIEGTDELSEKLNILIEKLKDETIEQLSEIMKYNFGNQHDQKSIDKMIECYASNLHLNIIPSPFDVFSNEDYEQINDDTIVLKSLNNMPSDYLDYVNYQNAIKYFESGNLIRLRYAGPNIGWELYFENNGEYGTIIDGKEDKYKKFITENKEFVADFLRATKDLIGSQHLLLDKILVSQNK